MRDRRAQYTVNIIKEDFLELEGETTFDKISIKKVCERAEVSRSAFYLHFDSLNDLLDEIIDEALLFSEEATGSLTTMLEAVRSGEFDASRIDDSVLPACQRIADDVRYRKLFMDESLSDYIIRKIYNHEKPKIVPEIMAKMKINENMADCVFKYMLYGSFYVNRSLKWEKNEQWYDLQKMVGRAYGAICEED